MKKITLPLLAGIITCGMTLSAFAQSDTSRLDLGYLTLNKNFTQTITIRGEDLEKMPFTNLDDAIAAWAFGAYTVRGTIQYIVDGNPVSDPNAYSIYDIESVTLVMNSAALTGTAMGNSELALVKTYRGKTPKGFTAAAQTGLINGNTTGGNKTYTNAYHNYYLRAWKNEDKWSVGLTANYQRDAFPQTKEINGQSSGVEPTTPLSLQRWRFNGYFTWRPDRNDEVELTAGFVTQGTDYKFPEENLSEEFKNKQPYFLPRLKWTGSWLPGLTNVLDVSWTKTRYTDRLNYDEYNPFNGLDNSRTYDTSKASRVWVRDHLAYAIKAGGGLTITPSVDASYQHLSDRLGYTSILQDATSIGGVSSGSGFSVSKGHVFLLTPSLDLTYKKAFNIEGGVVIDAGSNRSSDLKKALPYASAAVDLLHLTKEEGSDNLKLYASYAQRSIENSYAFQLGDLSYNPTSGLSSVEIAAPIFDTALGAVSSNVGSGFKRNWVWQVGIGYAAFNNRLKVDYTFERRNISTVGIFQGGSAFYEIYYAGWNSFLHHFNIKVGILDGPDLKWESGLSLTLLKSQLDDYQYGEIEKPTIGDVSPDGFSLTGGWVNRFRYKNFSFGMDLLFHLHHQVYPNSYLDSLSAYSSYDRETASISNIYVAYRVVKSLEVYFESRNLAHSKPDDLTDGRRYYTIGGKLAL